MSRTCRFSSTQEYERGGDARAALERALAGGGAVDPALLEGVHDFVAEGDGATRVYRAGTGLTHRFYRLGAAGGPSVGATIAEALDGAAPCIDRGALQEYLRLGDIAGPRSICQDVRDVEPGHLLTVTPTGASSRAWAAAPACAPPRGFDEAVDALEARLGEAVARRLAGASRAAAFLSGGVDSALICALAARRGLRVTALTVGFPDRELDEAPVAAAIAAHLGLAHRVLRFDRGQLLGAFDRLARGMDQPMADPATLATLLAFEQARSAFDVVLDGSGADEAVGAMPPRHVRLAVGLGSRVPAPLRRRLVSALARHPATAGYTPLLDFAHPAEPLMRWKGFSHAEIEALTGEPARLEPTAFYRTFARFPRGAHFARCSALLNAMPGDRLTQAMRLSGLDLRFPFGARDVDGFLRQLPTPWRHLPGQPKRILRALLARCVPSVLWDRPKQGFTFPLHDFLAADGCALVRRHVLEGRWLGRGLLRPEAVRAHARRYMNGERRELFRVWALVVLGAWLDAHEDFDCPPPRA
jgi:asparagine synthase (glutamine-hydrolysing)